VKDTGKRSTPLIIGWREHVGLPEFNIERLRAKIDSGARTSALHATKIEPFTRDGGAWARFLPAQSKTSGRQFAEFPVHDQRSITNTSGIPESRIVIRTRLSIKNRSWNIELSLTDRSMMKYPMIIGRSALRDHDLAVHLGRSFIVKK